MLSRKFVVTLGAAVAAVILAPAGSEAQISFDNNSIIRESTVVVGGGPCRIIDIDGSDVIIGRSNGSGSGEDIDLEVIDAFSNLSTVDQSFNMNASAADLNIGSGSAGAPGDAGDLNIENGEGGILIDIDGNTGNIFQDVDNTVVGNGNGAIKAWAKINSDGSIDSCWRCNTSTAQTRRLGEGQYEVDFSFSVSNRPCLASSGDHGTTDLTDKNVECYNSTDTSSKNVETNEIINGADDDGDFTVIIF